MNIYNLTKSEIAKKEKEFRATAYGKQQSALTKIIPLIGIIIALILLVAQFFIQVDAQDAKMICYNYICSVYMIAAAAACAIFSLIAYLNGRRRYLKELCAFVASCK